MFHVSLLLKDKLDSVGHIAEIDAPVLVVIAKDDEVIPRRHSDALAEAFPESQVIIEVSPGAGHNAIGMFPRYTNAMSVFLSTHPRQ